MYMNPYYTHRKHLRRILDSFNYEKNINILEFGIGYGSSEIFFEYALKQKNLKITAFETDKTWFSEISQKFQLDNYEFKYLENWGCMDYEKEKKLVDLLFIDQAPWESRIETLDFLGDRSRRILLHDYDYFNKTIQADDIYDISEKSFYGRYLKRFRLEAFYEDLPPTLTFEKK